MISKTTAPFRALLAAVGTFTMTEDQKLRRGWEQRFPGLTGEWTHWWIEGDGALLAIVGVEDLSLALDVVDTHHENRRWIMVYPARLGSSGEVVRDGKRGFEIEGRNKTR